MSPSPVDVLPYPLVPYQGREVDLAQPVRVYRNLHERGGYWSVQQGRLVVAHADVLMLANVRFVVSAPAFARGKRIGKKVVCAFAEGLLHPFWGTVKPHQGGRLAVRIRFDEERGVFTTPHCTAQGYRVVGANGAVFNEHGCTASFLDTAPLEAVLGRPRKQGGETKAFPVRLSKERRERYEKAAAIEGCEVAELVRRAADAYCDRLLGKEST